jgi:hypothetical protein
LVEDVARPVIRHAEQWGYCPAGATADHDWRATGGKTLATVRDWLGRPDKLPHSSIALAEKPELS